MTTLAEWQGELRNAKFDAKYEWTGAHVGRINGTTVKSVGLFLSIWADYNDATNAHPGVNNLVIATGFHRDQITRALQVLRRLGWVERTSAGKARRDADVYRMTIPNQSSGTTSQDENQSSGTTSSDAQPVVWNDYNQSSGTTPPSLTIPPSVYPSPRSSGVTFARVIHERDDDGGKVEDDTPIRTGTNERLPDAELRDLGWTILPDPPGETIRERRARQGHERRLRDEDYTGDDDPSLNRGTVSDYRSHG